MRSRCIAALSLAACAGVNTGQSHEVLAPPEAHLGQGDDSLSGETRGALESEPKSRTRRVASEVPVDRRREIARAVDVSGGGTLGLFGSTSDSTNSLASCRGPGDSSALRAKPTDLPSFVSAPCAAAVDV